MINTIVNLTVSAILTILIAMKLCVFFLLNPCWTTFVIAPSSKNIGDFLCSMLFRLCKRHIRIITPFELDPDERHLRHVTHYMICPIELMLMYCFGFKLLLNHFACCSKYLVVLLGAELQELVLALFHKFHVLFLEVLYLRSCSFRCFLAYYFILVELFLQSIYIDFWKKHFINA